MKHLVHCVLLACIAVALQSCGSDTVVTNEGSVRGRVLENKSSTAVEGAQVYSTPPTASVLTDAEGKFHIPNVAAGNYTIYATKPGVGNGSVAVSVAEKMETNADLYIGGGSSTEGPVVTSGLIAYYRLNGDAKDQSGYEYDGTLEGNPTFSEDRKGNSSSCIRFDGRTQRVRIPHDGAFHSMSMSLSFWVKFDGAPNPDALFIGMFLHPSGEGYSCFSDEGELCASNTRENFSRSARTCGPLPATSGWYHIAVTYSSAGTALYVNGAVNSTAVWSGTATKTTSTQDFMMGLLESTSVPMGEPHGLNGWMDDVYVFDRVLTTQEIQTLASE